MSDSCRRRFFALSAAISAFAVATPVLAQSPFTEEAVARGVDYAVGNVFERFGSGVAAVDLDGDGDPDLVALGASDGRVGVFENVGQGWFSDRSADSNIPLLPTASGVVAADFDGDGLLDLYISCWQAANVLLRNQGGFAFAVMAAGVDDDGKGTGCVWGDYDNDGRLDLYAANYVLDDSRNPLFHNLGNGAFEQVAGELGVDGGPTPTFQPVFFDFDRDGDADLYLSTDKGYSFPKTGWRNQLFENTGGQFVEVTDRSGTGAYIDSMGVAVGDFDHNGYDDLYCTNTYAGNLLLLNQGDGTFVDFTAQAGVGSFAVGWAALFLDYDNDGRTDLYVCNSSGPNRLYARTGGGWPATDLAAQLDVDDGGISFCLAAVDVDDDGDLDLFVSNAFDNLRLYINHEGHTRNWLKVRLRTGVANVFGVGARVEIRVGSTWQQRELQAGSGYKSSSPMTLHFGLGSATLVDQVRVHWPGGQTTVVDSVAANQTLTIRGPTCQAPCDMNCDGAIDAFDIEPFLDLLFGPDPLPCDTCTGDANGDGRVDAFDIEPFLDCLFP